jgi:hypothetical protein
VANKNRFPEEPSSALEQPWADTMPAADPPPPPADAAVSAPERLTPHAWGEKLGLCEKADPARPWIESHADWRFAAADKLHGWSDHAHHWQGPDQQLLLTEQDFQAALQAGADYPAKPAHGPACGKGFEDRALTKEQLEAKAKTEKAEVTRNG